MFCYLTTEDDLMKCAKAIASHLLDGRKALVDCAARVSFQDMNMKLELQDYIIRVGSCYFLLSR